MGTSLVLRLKKNKQIYKHIEEIPTALLVQDVLI